MTRRAAGNSEPVCQENTGKDKGIEPAIINEM